MSFLLIVLTLAFAGSSLSQQSSLSINLETGLPTGDFSNVAKIGIGGGVAYGYALSPDIMLTFKSGYLSFPKADFPPSGYPAGDIFSDSASFSAVPILVGGKYFLNSGDTRFYGSAEIGMYILTATSDVNNSFKTTSTTKGEFAFAPGVGTQFKAGSKTNIDLHLVLSNVLTPSKPLNWINFGVGFSFGL